jgi:hypothetical protein
MPLSDADRERLDDYQFQMGDDAGRLALAMDRLTDAMAQLGVHATYCRVEKGPRAGQPPLDLAELLDTLQSAKDLVRDTLTRLRERPS